jgi:hypothetical protein
VDDLGQAGNELIQHGFEGEDAIPGLFERASMASDQPSVETINNLAPTSVEER